jgi:hypothetical protein
MATAGTIKVGKRGMVVLPAKLVPECLYREDGAQGPGMDSRLRGNDALGPQNDELALDGFPLARE